MVSKSKLPTYTVRVIIPRTCYFKTCTVCHPNVTGLKKKVTWTDSNVNG